MEIAVPEVLSLESLEELKAALDRAASEEGARVWVLRGRPGTFCRGMDLAGLGEDPNAIGRGTQLFADCLARLQAAPRPTLALVDGEVLGGGIGLLAACDLALATRRSTFGLPEALFGLLPAIVMPVLLQRLSPQKARLLAMGAGSREANWALAAGLVDELVAPEESERQVARHARDLARTLPEGATALRQWVLQAGRLDLGAGLERAARMTAELACDSVIRERIRAFAEQGVPPWKSP